MNRILSAAAIAGLCVAAIVFERSPQGASWRGFSTEILAANAIPQKPERITAIDVPRSGDGMSALDAALILRATLRYEPQGIGFLIPIAPGAEGALLSSKLEDARIPVAFTAGADPLILPKIAPRTSLPELSGPGGPVFTPPNFLSAPAVTAPPGRIAILARNSDRVLASNVWAFCVALQGIPAGEVAGRIPGWVRAGAVSTPVDREGRAQGSRLAAALVDRVELSQVVLQTERNEQGSISPALDSLFRGRAIVVQGVGDTAADAVAAVRNRLSDLPAPLLLCGLFALLGASLPWWSPTRGGRMMLALLATSLLLLAALGLYSALRLTVPVPVLLALPLLALIPGRGRSLPPAKPAEAPAGEA